MRRLNNVCLSLTGVKAPRQVSNIGPFETKKENPNISRRLFPNHCCHFHSLRATFRRGRKMLGLWPRPLSVLCNVPSTSSIPDTQTHSKKDYKQLLLTAANFTNSITSASRFSSFPRSSGEAKSWELMTDLREEEQSLFNS